MARVTMIAKARIMPADGGGRIVSIGERFEIDESRVDYLVKFGAAEVAPSSISDGHWAAATFRQDPTVAETADRIAPIPAETVAWLGAFLTGTGPLTRRRFDDAYKAWAAAADPLRVGTTSIPVALKRSLGLPDDALEEIVVAEIRARLSMRDRVANTPGSDDETSPLDRFRAKVAERLTADADLDVASAQRMVAAEDPELFSEIRLGSVTSTEAVHMSAGGVLAAAAHSIAKRDGVPLGEAQRRAAAEWPEWEHMYRYGVVPPADGGAV